MQENLKYSNHKRRRKNRVKKPYIFLMLLLSLAVIAFLCALILLNIFPPDFTIIMAVGISGLLVLSCFLMARKRRLLRLAGLLLALVLIAGCGFVAGFMNSTNETLNQISGSSKTATGPASKSTDVTEEPFNVYITGIDQWESEKGLDLERSDVNMIVTVNPVTKKVLLTSIPRDTYVNLHTAQQMDKLTHTGVYGVDETLNTVEDWLGIDLNYYVKMNFTAVSDMINAMGGIKVYSPVEFESSLRGYKYVKGWNRLSGHEALYFARERHAFEGQDSVRVENQQRVMKAVIKKLTSSTTLLTSYDDIMKVAGDNFSTNMSADEITDLVRMQMTDLAEWDVETQKIEGEYDMDYVASLSSKNMYSIYRPDDASVKKCVDTIKGLMIVTAEEREAAEKIKSRSMIMNYLNRLKEKADSAKDKKE